VSSRPARVKLLRPSLKNRTRTKGHGSSAQHVQVHSPTKSKQIKNLKTVINSLHIHIDNMFLFLFLFFNEKQLISKAKIM
jgi:hypothetical protein